MIFFCMNPVKWGDEWIIEIKSVAKIGGRLWGVCGRLSRLNT